VIIAYLIICWRTSRRFDLWVMLSVVVYCAGVVAGGLLILSTLITGLRARLSGIDLYIFMAGIAVIAISARPIFTDVFGWPKQSAATTNGEATPLKKDGG